MKFILPLIALSFFLTLSCGKAPETEKKQDGTGKDSGRYDKAVEQQCIGFFKDAIEQCKAKNPGQNCCKIVRFQLPDDCSQRYMNDCTNICRQFSDNAPFDKRAVSYCFSELGGGGKGTKCRPQDEEQNSKNKHLPTCRFD